MSHRSAALAALLAGYTGCAAAMVGATQPPADDATRAAVLLVGSNGTSCTGVAIARDLVLTAAHCVLPGADYKLVAFDAARTPTLKDTAAIAPIRISTPPRRCAIASRPMWR